MISRVSDIPGCCEYEEGNGIIIRRPIERKKIK